ncbi:NH(3)-dependent NAD(+) synthetase [wastewater metagenome]|uniref:NH(3)-dependent NAD(+) synthetase n=4 Tax=root TaxID=1 RepID=A0A5B8RBU1_9ZZZZ|nr:NAD(+) synthase [Arhodomonas aquaeolei]MCS4505809.1 NAD(+) synthase [Arhodomonas aquaeolei]QEA06270.1 NH(3)-dependent NAD(+) synthetase [uncultured organism]
MSVTQPIAPAGGGLHPWLALDCEAEAERIAAGLRRLLAERIGRRGLVVAVSGGIDSALCAALAVRAVGPRRVFALMLPERDSDPETQVRARALVEQLGVPHQQEDIAPMLEAVGCYRWRDEAMRTVFPDYDADWSSKIVIRGGLEGRYNHFELVVRAPGGRQRRRRLGYQAYLQIVAATNFKQRVRKTLEYFHADRLNYAVVGTPNRLEYDQGFFVKGGDGAADVKPIAHLYKSQVYALARHLGVPESICTAAPTTDTYSLPQGQDEFYFALPYDRMDLALYARNHHMPAETLAEALGVAVTEAEHIYRDIDVKRRTTRYLHESGLTVVPVPEVPLP